VQLSQNGRRIIHGGGPVTTQDPSREDLQERLRALQEENRALQEAHQVLEAAHQQLQRHHDRTRRGLLRAQGAARRLRGLLVGMDRASVRVQEHLAMVDGHDPHDILQIIVDQARELVDARYAALGVGTEPGVAFDPWISSGFSPVRAARIGRTPRNVGLLQATGAARRCIRLRDLTAHPAFGGFPEHYPAMTSFLATAVRWRERSVGVLCLANKRSGDEFTREDEQLVQMLGRRAGIALELVRLRQLERSEEGRLRFLAKMGPLLAPSLDEDETLDAIAAMPVPELADVAWLSLLEGHHQLRTVAAGHAEPQLRQRLGRCRGVEPVAGLSGVLREVLTLSRSMALLEVTDADAALTGAATDLELVAELGLRWLLVLPLVGRRGPLGLLRLGRRLRSAPGYRAEEVALGREAAHRAALAVEASRLHRTVQQAVQSREHLMAIVSHDLRNPLMAIQLAADMLLQGATGGRGTERRSLEAIRKSTDYMARLINSLHDAAIVESGRLGIRTAREPLAPLIQGQIAMWEARAEKEGIALGAELPARPLAAWCDRQRVEQVLSNLIGNAIKFVGKGGHVVVRVRPGPGDQVTLSVRDTGEGIAGDVLPYIFDQYFSQPRQARDASTGLGLYIARGIVEAHGGTIWAESTVGQGATFHFTLPAAPHLETTAGHELHG
jgi:signal transduction histidine kinase